MSDAEHRRVRSVKTGFSVRRLRGSILRSVSRSFYLSVRLLPRRLREPVALAYLLARSTDTIADTTEISPAVRAEQLAILARAIEGKAAPNAALDLVRSFAPRQKNPDERALIESLPRCLEWLENIDPTDRNEIRGVLEKITRGQTLDLQRFPDANAVRALPTANDLDEYTYLVAGCVGEFWTRLCFRHVRRFTKLSEIEMSELGKRYGMGLQLINILRDAGPDLRKGRCYFPQEELDVALLQPSDILREPDRFRPIFRKWREKAEDALSAGVQYSLAIRNRRVRAATVLPALIGARTLALLRDAGTTALRRTIKVPRQEVRAMVSSLIVTLAARSEIEEIFARYKK
jgi:farnesyl-diphosphate farnesyltransferase